MKTMGSGFTAFDITLRNGRAQVIRATRMTRRNSSKLSIG